MIAFLLLHHGSVATPAYHLLTYRRGTIRMARFAPTARRLFTARPGKADRSKSSTRVLVRRIRPRIPGAEILAISSTGEMAVLLHSQQSKSQVYTGTLARMPLGGGAPREILENIQWADWSPDGTQLAIVRDVNGRNRLEYPPGRVLYETGGWVSHPRISRKGDMIAFIDHPIPGDSIGSVALVDMSGKKRTLSQTYGGGAVGLAWSPGDEVWNYGDCDWNRPVHVCRSFVERRLVARVPADLTHKMSYPMDVLCSPATAAGLIARRASDATEHVSPGWIGLTR